LKKRVNRHKITPKSTLGNKWLVFTALTALFLLVGAFWYFSRETKGVNEVAKDTPKGKAVIIETSKGNVEMAVYPDLMPVTVNNFEKLVGSNFYNGLSFHRVEPWVVQGGDPKGNGKGGPGWAIKLEISPELKNVRGAVAMARSQNPDSAGSQFYILKKDSPHLDGNYAVFGRVTEGMEVVDKFEPGEKMIRVRFK